MQVVYKRFSPATADYDPGIRLLPFPGWPKHPQGDAQRRALMLVTATRGNSHRVSGMGSDLEAFSHYPARVASPQRPVDRGLYQMRELAVPLVLR